jgi:NTE family protein
VLPPAFQPAPDDRHAHQEPLLQRLLQQAFGDLEADTLAQLRAQLEWVELAGGQTLMEQGEAGDSLYISVSGRLRAYARQSDGREQMLREMSRGQVIGEMALLTGEPRTATVVAIRESVLVRLSKAGFDALIAQHPGASAALARQLIRRLQKQQPRSLLERPVTMGLMPVSAGVDIRAFAASLAGPLAQHGRVQVVDAAAVNAALAPAGLSLADEGPELNRRVALLLDEIEAQTEFVLLLADDAPTPWTQRCTRHCDELLLVADPAQAPQLHASEEALLVGRPPRAEAAEILVLLHGATPTPAGAATRWLQRRAVTELLHVRQGHAPDFERLARLQSRSAVGLVLAGGGARGFAHLGVLRALQERGVAIDAVGGTSMGAVMALLVASDEPRERVEAIAREAFALNPTGDLNPLPLISVIRGQRLQRVVRAALQRLLGREATIEALWKPFFCIASNYTQAREELLERGPILQALLASIAIPGALPPVVRDGDLLCDGGTFNNFPVDVMQQRRGIGTVIGVDLSQATMRPVPFQQMPNWWQLALDRLRPRRRRRYRLPSLPAYLMNVTILYSVSRRVQARAAADLVFNPPLYKVGMLEWSRFDDIARQGYEHARQELERLECEQPALLARIRSAAAGADAALGRHPTHPLESAP